MQPRYSSGELVGELVCLHVLHTRCHNIDPQDESQRIDRQKAFASLDLFPCIISTACLTIAALLTLYPQSLLMDWQIDG